MNEERGGDDAMKTQHNNQTRGSDQAPAGHELNHLAELVRRAQQGDATVIPALRLALEADPSLWQEYGDLVVDHF